MVRRGRRAQPGHRFLPLVAMLVAALLVSLGATLAPCVRAARAVRVASYEYAPLISEGPQGTAMGLLPDILRQVGTLHGWRIQYVPGTWQEGVDRLSSGRVDLVVGMDQGPVRAREFSLNRLPVVSTWAQVYTLPGASRYRRLDFHGKRVAGLAGDLYFQAFKDLARSFRVKPIYLTYGDVSAAFHAVRSGAADAVVCERVGGATYQQIYRLSQNSLVFYPQTLGFATTKGTNSGLLEAIDTYLAAGQGNAKSTYARTLARWLDARAQTGGVPPGIRWVLLGVAVLLVLTGGAALLLSKLVHERSAEVTEQNGRLLERAAFDALLTRILGDFATALGAASEPKVARALRALASFFGADYAQVSLLNAARTHWVSTYSYWSPGATRRVEPPEGVLVGSRPWLEERLISGEGAAVPDVSRLGDEAAAEAKALTDLDVRAFLAVGVRGANGQVIGLLGVQNHSRCVAWPEAATGQLGMVGDAIAGLLERERAEAALAEQEGQYRAVVENMQDTFYRADSQGRLELVSPSIEALLGIPAEMAKGLDAAELYAEPGGREAFIRAIRANGAVVDYETTLRGSDGEPVFVSFTAHLRVTRGEVVGTEGVIRNITDRKRMEKYLASLSRTDPLTGLGNRFSFEEEASRLLVTGEGKTDRLGLVLCDLDGLRLVNETLGHECGDDLLRATAQVLRRCFGPGPVITRVGGDEFAVLLPGADEASVQAAVQALRAAVENHHLDDGRLVLRLAVGSAIGERGITPLSRLFREADAGVYRDHQLHGQSNRDAITQTLMMMLRARDFETEDHTGRLSEYMTAVSSKLGLSQARADDLRLFARFHDIGKIGVPDSVLLKAGPLTEAEWVEMRRHSDVGYRIAQSSLELAPIAEWILRHHERWDGRGYPLGDAGTDIPLECRLLAILDAYDAMTADRPYRRAMSREAAVDQLLTGAGTQFDPELVAVCLEVVGWERSS